MTTRWLKLTTSLLVASNSANHLSSKITSGSDCATVPQRQRSRKTLVSWDRLQSVTLSFSFTLKMAPKWVSSKLKWSATLKEPSKLCHHRLHLKKSPTSLSNRKNSLKQQLKLKRPTNPCQQTSRSQRRHNPPGRPSLSISLTRYLMTVSLLRVRLVLLWHSRTASLFSIWETAMFYRWMKVIFRAVPTTRSAIVLSPGKVS